MAVRENTKETILRSGNARLQNSPAAEQATALVEIAKIANLRLLDIVEEPVTSRSPEPMTRTRPAGGPVARRRGRGRTAASPPSGRCRQEPGDEVVRVDGDIVTAGLVNTHHHFYQWMTRGWAFDCTLFGWLTTLYPVWARLTPEDVEAASAVAMGELALTGCTTAADHHYLVPGGDDSVFDAIAAAARTDRHPGPHRPRLHGPGPEQRAACRPTRWSRTWTPSWPRPSRSTTGCTTATGSWSPSPPAARSASPRS